MRHWDLERPDSLRHLIGLVNAVRARAPGAAARRHPAIPRCRQRSHRLLEQARGGRRPEGSDGHDDVVLFVVNLDPVHTQSGWTALDLPALGFAPDAPIVVHDLLTESRYDWGGPHNFVALDPATVPADVFSVTGARA